MNIQHNKADDNFDVVLSWHELKAIYETTNDSVSRTKIYDAMVNATSDDEIIELLGSVDDSTEYSRLNQARTCVNYFLS